MNVSLISPAHMLLAFVPVAMVAWISYLWARQVNEIGVAVFRMAIQLLLIGYVLAWLFKQQNLFILGGVLVIMSLVSTWIGLRKVTHSRWRIYSKTLLVIFSCSLFILAVVVLGVLSLKSELHSRIVIPLAGMVFSSAMTAVSLASERYYSEMLQGAVHDEARNVAFNTSLIPIINSMLAVGLVALPGMMTGQILSGVSPLIAVRYQIVVMCMVFGVAGLSSASFLQWVARDMLIKNS